MFQKYRWTNKRTRYRKGQSRYLTASTCIHNRSNSRATLQLTSHIATIKPIHHRLSLSLSAIDRYRGKNKRIDDISWIVRFLSRLDLRTIRKKRRERSNDFNERRRTIVRYSLKYNNFYLRASHDSISQLIATNTFPHGRD